MDIARNKDKFSNNKKLDKPIILMYNFNIQIQNYRAVKNIIRIIRKIHINYLKK